MDNKQTAGNLPGAGPGRPKGSPNRVTTVLKEAILRAAETSGEDGQGRDGLEGYCRFLAREEPRAFATLLGKVLPMQVNASMFMSQEDALDELSDWQDGDAAVLFTVVSYSARPSRGMRGSEQPFALQHEPTGS